MKYQFFVLLSIITASCQVENHRSLENIIESSFEVKQISGYDRPKIDIKKDSLYLVLTALHYGIPIQEINSEFGWTEEYMQKNLHALIENNLLKENGNIYSPGLCILTLQRGNVLKEKSTKVSREISDSIVAKLYEIKDLHTKTDISKQHDFQELSFFYLSNMLLDNGQINKVEKEFLKKDRPLRNGSRYYLAIQEKDKTATTEAYGLYGNAGLHFDDSIYIAVYGNTRVPSNPGWQNYLNKPLYTFNTHDVCIITQEMPNVFCPTLISILEKNRAFFLATYKALNFDKEISFEEFFIWWYHFIYTKATDILIEKQIISKPETGLFYYAMLK